MRDNKKLVLVIGPHRSGTSLTTAAMECVGAELRLPIQYANDENRKGFFEHPEIVNFNDELLVYLGGSWDNPLFDGPAAIAKADLTQWISRAAQLFDSIYGGARVAAIKDPRLCQLLDFWKQVFGACGYSNEEIYVVHVFRGAAEVALSQQQRTKENPAFYEIGASLVEGAALWLSLTVQALTQTRGLRNYFIHYSRLLSDPELVLKELAEYIGLVPDQIRMGVFCESFVDKKLHRSLSAPDVLDEISRALPQIDKLEREIEQLRCNESSFPEFIDKALQLYQDPSTQRAISIAMAPAISRLSERSRRDKLESVQRADIIADLEKQLDERTAVQQQQFDELTAVIAPLRSQIGNLEQGNSSLQEQLNAQTAEHAKAVSLTEELANTIAEMQLSTSWRLTRPLRLLGRIRREVFAGLARSAARFKLISVYQYQRMSVSHPRFAWACRIALRPLFRIVNRISSGSVSHYLQATAGSSFSRMLYQQKEPSESYRPFISIIVPNYNHADFLPLRLDSIYAQTYQNFEVILLDDASTDASADILTHYCLAHPEITSINVSLENSGGVFHQWEKGLKLARGEIIWIAESDDWCSENFLETLVPYFENEAVQLAYCRTVFMDASGSRPHWSINEYLQDIDPHRWNAPILETANRIVADAFAIKNIIPNVSSAIFRNPGQLELLQDKQWKDMQVCGDWVFYLHLIRGGVLAYSPEACNYYRIHGQNTSVKTYSGDDYYLEHEFVAKVIQKYFRVDAGVFERLRRNLIAHWREFRSSYCDDDFDACFSLSRIREEAREREPNLLMASYGFCSGGGETFPIELANLLKGLGYNVTYLDCAQEPRNEDVRRNLRLDIPIVSDFSQLERIVADFGIDLIHSHHAWVDSTILDVLPETATCKTVVTLHGMYETINSVDLKFILPRLVRRSARLVYVAEKNLLALRKHKLIGDAKLVRIENALPVVDFQVLRRSDFGIAEEAFVLTLVSRAMEEKGWQEAIDIVTGARELTKLDIHLLLVGDGIEYERLLGLDLPAYIHLLGFQRNVRGFFAIANVGFLPSKFRGESFPLVIIECLQAGRPFLASNLGDIGYMIDSPEGPAGILVDLDELGIDLQAWIGQISAIASDRDWYASLCSRVPGAVKKFDSSIMAKKYDEIYRSALNESN